MKDDGTESCALFDVMVCIIFCCCSTGDFKFEHCPLSPYPSCWLCNTCQGSSKHSLDHPTTTSTTQAVARTYWETRIMPAASPSLSPLLAGLLDHRVSAQVKDLDHYRIHGGMAVETDYIIHVNCCCLSGNKKKTRPEPDFDSFIISKTFSAFRCFADQLHDAANALMSKRNNKDLPRKVRSLANCCHAILQLVDSQRTQYLGKVSNVIAIRNHLFSVHFIFAQSLNQ